MDHFTYALAEARRNLGNRSQKARLTRLLRDVVLVDDAVESDLPSGIELPAKDRPILLSAIAAQATHLLTGDVKHFGRYFRQTIAGVMILLPAEFVEVKVSKAPEAEK